jgi:hypothetical protein
MAGAGTRGARQGRYPGELAIGRLSAQHYDYNRRSPKNEAFVKETRDVVQAVYIRRNEKVDGKIVYVDIDKIESVKDPVKTSK